MGWSGGLQKVGEVYHCRLQHQGREIRRSTGKRTLEAARKWLRQFRDALDDIAEGRAPAPTTRDLFAAWAVDHRDIHSRAHLDRVERDARLYLLPEFGDLPADEFTSADMAMLRAAFLAGSTAKGRKHTAAGANIMLRHFRLVWNWAVAVGKLPEVAWDLEPLRVQRRPKVVLPESKVPAFLAAIDGARNPHVGIAVRAQLFLGLRESESLKLRWDLLARDGSTYTPGNPGDEEEFRSKGGEAVALPVDPDFLARMLRLAGEKVIPLSGWVLPADDGQPHRGQFTRKAIARAGVVVGCPGLTPHRLRGTCATLMARAGVDPFVIQQMLRHKDLKTTQGYVEVHASDMRDAQDALLVMGGIKSRKGGRRKPHKQLA